MEEGRLVMKKLLLGWLSVTLISINPISAGHKTEAAIPCQDLYKSNIAKCQSMGKGAQRKACKVQAKKDMGQCKQEHHKAKG